MPHRRPRRVGIPRVGYDRLTDIGHFDVPDMTAVVPEAYELVEHGLIDDDDFRDFTFANAVRFWGEVNPDFFKGTTVEKAAAEGLASPR